MRRIKAFLLAMALVATLSGVAAMAQDRDRDRDDYNYQHRDNDDYRWGRNQTADAREYGFHQGYRDGWYNGRNARNSRWNYNNNNVRPDDDRNYQSWMGPKGQYKKGYRDGYRSGYSDAYYGRRPQETWTYGQNGRRTPWDPDGDGDVHSPPLYPNAQYGGNYGNNGNAQRFGYQDGLTAGQRDRSSRHSYRPTEWEAYRDADHGMSSSTGYRSSDDYKSQYRNAFMNGYNQGYGRR